MKMLARAGMVMEGDARVAEFGAALVVSSQRSPFGLRLQ